MHYLGVVISAVLNCPGCWHDAHTANPVYVQLGTHTPDGSYLVADTAFPQGTAQIAGKIKAPLKSGQHLPADPSDVLEFNRQLLSYRQTAEWGMRVLQGSFGRLRLPLNIADDRRRARFLETVVRASNLRTLRVGINQIRSVYMPTWQASEDERLWSDLGNMVFGVVRRNDRVARFHLVAQ